MTAALLAVLTGCTSGTQKKTETPAAKKSAQVPDLFRVRFQTSKGDFIIEVHRAWAPRGADHFHGLVEARYYEGVRFHRVVRNFVVQWGINGDPSVSRLWANLRILDDPPGQSNKKGTVAFAHNGPATRATQVFINLADNVRLDKAKFVPFGVVTQGMDVVERLWSAYGEMPPRGNGPDPARIEREGNAYLEQSFPRLDYIKKASIEVP